VHVYGVLIAVINLDDYTFSMSDFLSNSVTPAETAFIVTKDLLAACLGLLTPLINGIDKSIDDELK